MTVITGEKYGMTTRKPGAYLQAFLRVSSEHRRYVNLYGVCDAEVPSDETVREQDRRWRIDTSLLPEDLAQIERTDSPIERHAGALLHHAADDARRGQQARAASAFRRAHFLAPHRAEASRDKTSPHFLDALDLILPRKAPAKPVRADDS